MAATGPFIRRLVATSLLAALTGSLAVVVAQSPTTPSVRAATPLHDAAISGVVVDEVSGQPVGGTIVLLVDKSPTGTSPSRQQVTTPRGRFAFVDLPASDSYLLTAVKAGYLTTAFGQSEAQGAHAPIALKPMQWMRDVRVPLARPGAINGTVVDERGEPVVDVAVRVLRRGFIAGRAQWLAGTAARTDDRGIYRIAGLVPGTYVVSVPSVQATLPESATIAAWSGGAGSSRADIDAARAAAQAERLVRVDGAGQGFVLGRSAVPPSLPDGPALAYPTTFHPTSASLAGAGLIELRTSENRSGVDVQLQPVRTARVSGVVVGPPEAVGNVLLRLMAVDLEDLGQGSEAATTMTTGEGRFTFMNVPLGSYVLDVSHGRAEITSTGVSGASTAIPEPIPFVSRGSSGMSLRGLPPGAGLLIMDDGAPAKHWARQRVDVSALEVGDIEVPVHRSVSLSATIQWVAGRRAPTSNSRVFVLEPASGSRSLGVPLPAPVVLASDLAGADPATQARMRSMLTDPAALEFKSLRAGEYFLRVLFGDGAIESITWNGEDYTNRAFNAADGKDFTGVVVTLTDLASSVSGVVTAGNTPVTNGAVVAFPADPSRWTNFGFNPPGFRTALVGSDGHFRLTGLPIGDYNVVAVPTSDEWAWVDPAFMQKHSAHAEHVRIDRSDAVLSNVSLRMTP